MSVPPDVKPAVVLVVDDRESKRYILGSWLRRAGYQVVEAATGAQALRRLTEAPPDLAVLDIHLPDMSGLEVCRRIKGDRASAGIPVLHVSAIAVDAADRSAGLDGGADAYLVDPIEPREFLSTVKALLRQSRRFATEHRIAHTLQRSLLPAALPDLAGLRVAARYHASADQAEIGGDFYDAFETPTGHAAIVIGDVQGHSLAAAVIMAQLRYSLRAYAFDGHGPQAIVERLNRLMVAHHPDSTATLCIITFTPDRSHASIVNAGHLPPLLIEPDGLRYWDGGGSVLLGIEAPPPGLETIPISPGTRVLLFTDGLVERRDRSLEESLAEFARLLGRARTFPDESAESARPRSLTALADQLIAVANEAEDDVALVIAEVDRPRPA
ncbi:PP2C family protein-serine/threonine phosphatase [Frankia sp. R82]|uniref:PP2C family protein-serine/threonine phosphatase n=1 Tax=Frankia sp. R82 TaxID=2950553 RepID=UPI00204344BC|nr:fused response regulator/phosphatase [Frankia sp. R82]MCM3882314.1 fused response regulator/phosphatase [Frankia sp. R82]